MDILNSPNNIPCDMLKIFFHINDIKDKGMVHYVYVYLEAAHGFLAPIFTFT